MKQYKIISGLFLNNKIYKAKTYLVEEKKTAFVSII